MRKIREVLRLAASGLSQTQISRSCSIAQSTIHKYIRLAQAANLAWPLPEDWDEPKLRSVLLGRETATNPTRRTHAPPDFAAIHQELQDHKNLTLELVWREYRQAQPAGYRYSRFCDLHREWAHAQKLTLRQDQSRFAAFPNYQRDVSVRRQRFLRGTCSSRRCPAEGGPGHDE